MEINVKKLLKKESSNVFDVNKEKNAFLKRLYSENITPPINIHSYPLRTSNFFNTKTAYGVSSVVMSFSIIASIVSLVIPRVNQSPISLTSPVLASIVISNDDNYDDDPEFDLTFDTNGEVTSIVAANDDAKACLGAALVDEDNNIDFVTHLIFDSSTTTHYIDVNAKKTTPNKVNVLLTGVKEDVSTIKTHMGEHCADYFKSNYIFANLKDISTASTDEEMIQEGKEEAEKYGITFERYVLLQKIYKALSEFDSSLVFDQDFVNSYKEKSIETLTTKAGVLIRSIEKLQVIKKIKDFDEKVKSKIENYQMSKNTNYSYWLKAFEDFKTTYDEVVEDIETNNLSGDLSFVNWEEIAFEQFEISSLFKWLCDKTSPFFASPDMTEKVALKKSYVNTKYSNIQTLQDKYENLKALVGSYRQEEKAREADIITLFKQNEDILIQESEKNLKYYEQCQDEREKDGSYLDLRDDEFYYEFENTNDDYFYWQD